jgi:hypothetical protein
VHEERVGDEAETERCEEHRARAPEAVETSGRKRRALPHGGDRRHPRRPERRPEAGEQGDQDPDRERDDDSPGFEREPVVREREADRVEQLEEPLREREAEEEAGDRGEDADDERLDDDRAEHLPA